MGRNVLTVIAALFALLIASLAGSRTQPAAASAPSHVLFAQACVKDDNTVTVNVQWTGDPAAREVWIDSTSFNADFEDGTFRSDGPISSRAANYRVTGLDPHEVYWFRVNQLMPSGNWEASSPQRYVLGCGNETAPAGSIRITGVTAGDVDGQPNSSLKVCNPPRLTAHLKVAGLTEVADVTYIWSKNNSVFARYASAFDSETGDWSVSYTTGGSGFSEGTYRFELWTGGDGTWKLSAATNFTLDC